MLVFISIQKTKAQITQDLDFNWTEITDEIIVEVSHFKMGNILGDQEKEIVLIEGDNVNVYLINESGELELLQSTTPQYLSRRYDSNNEFKLADLDNDGYKDLIWLDHSFIHIIYAKNLSLIESIRLERSSTKMDFIDFNQDGYLDIVATTAYYSPNSYQGGYHFVENKNAENLSFVSTYIPNELTTRISTFGKIASVENVILATTIRPYQTTNCDGFGRSCLYIYEKRGNQLEVKKIIPHPNSNEGTGTIRLTKSNSESIDTLEIITADGNMYTTELDINQNVNWKPSFQGVSFLNAEQIDVNGDGFDEFVDISDWYTENSRISIKSKIGDNAISLISTNIDNQSPEHGEKLMYLKSLGVNRDIAYFTAQSESSVEQDEYGFPVWKSYIISIKLQQTEADLYPQAWDYWWDNQAVIKVSNGSSLVSSMGSQLVISSTNAHLEPHSDDCIRGADAPSVLICDLSEIQPWDQKKLRFDSWSWDNAKLDIQVTNLKKDLYPSNNKMIMEL